MTKAKEGERFSLNYLRHPELLPDSLRMRRRIGSLVFQHGGSELYALLNRRLGTDVAAYHANYESKWTKDFSAMDLRDVLDSITVVSTRTGRISSVFLSEVRTVFQEEQVRYAVDDKGGVHFAVDQAFEQTRIATVITLGAARYTGVREALDRAYAALDQVPPDGKGAIRATFFACESLFRLAYPSAHQLGISEMAKHLKVAVDQRYDGQKPALYAAQKQFKQFQDWVEGAHFYRHEPGTEEPSQPPLEVAIHYVTSGTAWLRWLQGFDPVR